MHQDRIFTRYFLLNMSISMFCSMNFFMMTVCMMGYSTSNFGATTAEAGIVTGLYVIGGLISRVIFGKYIELVGRKKMIMLGLTGAVIMSAMYFLVSSLAMLFVVRFLHGMMYGINATCAGDIASKLVPASRRGEGLGYFALGITFSTAIGPLIGVNVVNGTDYTLLFFIGMMMYVLALLFSVFLKVEEESLTPEEIKEAKSFKFSNLVFTPAVPLAIVCTIFYFAYSSIHTFIAAYGASLDLVTAASYFYITLSVATLISRLTTGKIYDKNGPNIIMIPGFLSFAGGMWLFSTATDTVTFLLSSLLIGYGISIIYAVGQAIIITKAPPQKYGVATSTYSSLVDVGTGVGPMVLGSILPMVGYSNMYLLCGIIGFLSMFVYWGLHGQKAYIEKHRPA